jgi:octaprenyl-diphosphate synthase
MSKFEDIQALVAPERAEFERQFKQKLSTRVPLADNVIRYFLDCRGKQLRPLLTFLAVRLLDRDWTDATIKGAVALELLHNASLIHDDVVDQSEERRGMASINHVWDNRVAVLMGDFFLSKCLTASTETGSLAVSNILSEMVTRLCEGELEQMSNVRSHTMTEHGYFSVISGKTASLFAACLKVGALTVNATPDEMERISVVGEKMGLIFQIRDDIFDYFPTNAQVGKPTGHDIAEGKVTLPLLYALRTASAEESRKMYALLDVPSQLTPENVTALVDFAKSLGGIEYAQARMKQIGHEARQVLNTFPDNKGRTAIAALIDFFIERDK